MCVYSLCCLFQAQSSVMNGTRVRPGSVSNTTDKFSDGVSSTTQDGHITKGQPSATVHNQELMWSVGLIRWSLSILDRSLICFGGHFANHLCDD